jgi:hypothetical protein
VLLPKPLEQPPRQLRLDRHAAIGRDVGQHAADAIQLGDRLAPGGVGR